MKNIFVYLHALIVLLISPSSIIAQEHQKRFEEIDVTHYTFNIQLSDSNDRIEAVAEIKVRFKKSITKFNLDFVNVSNGKGMMVTEVFENDTAIVAQHLINSLKLFIPETKIDEERTYRIHYIGVPADGLIISKNKYGNRTFFGDNWPDRARFWLPVVDHPSDKATVEWIVRSPKHYQTIANGILIEKKTIGTEQIQYHWKSTKPIPTKVMVIGVANFAIDKQDDLLGIPLSSWVYPKDSTIGFSDFKLASPILSFFIDNIGDYPFEKLANVQSKTKYGGMENAGNIFYSENCLTGDGKNEDLIAHEIAHQWFGNSATEENWYHIWLSEGFATYFSDLYFEHKYGHIVLIDHMIRERDKVIDYDRKTSRPIIDQQIGNYNHLLNTNSYEKGSWILHMLRKELGDSLFWKAIQNYYEKYKYSNALTEDFQRAAEEVSNKNLSFFFQQWLYQPGIPKLNISWNYKAINNQTTAAVEDTGPIETGIVELKIKQVQKSDLFFFPLEVKLNYTDGTSSIETVYILDKSEVIKISTAKPVISIVTDPNTWLLYELFDLTKSKL